MENSRAVPQKRVLANDAATPLLGIDPEEVKAKKRTDICTPMFIAVLFTIAKRWKQSTCSLMSG